MLCSVVQGTFWLGNHHDYPSKFNKCISYKYRDLTQKKYQHTKPMSDKRHRPHQRAYDPAERQEERNNALIHPLMMSLIRSLFWTDVGSKQWQIWLTVIVQHSSCQKNNQQLPLVHHWLIVPMSWLSGLDSQSSGTRMDSRCLFGLRPNTLHFCVRRSCTGVRANIFQLETQICFLQAHKLHMQINQTGTKWLFGILSDLLRATCCNRRTEEQPPPLFCEVTVAPRTDSRLHKNHTVRRYTSRKVHSKKHQHNDS